MNDYDTYVVIEGWFYDSGRYSKSKQFKVMTWLSYMLHYSWNCIELFRGSENECNNHLKTLNNEKVNKRG